MYIDHLTIHVESLENGKKFYTPVFEALGGKMLMDMPEYGTTGYGNERPFYWISENAEMVGGQQHIAIAVDSKEKVHAFYDVALENGAKDNGAPGPRPHYGDDYYAAFVITPEGHNLEAVYRKA